MMRRVGMTGSIRSWYDLVWDLDWAAVSLAAGSRAAGSRAAGSLAAGSD